MISTDELEYWQADSAAAWDTCEKRRLEGEVLKAELIAARAKIAAAEALAEAVRHEREMVCQDIGRQMDLSAWTDEMLARWEALK